MASSPILSLSGMVAQSRQKSSAAPLAILSGATTPLAAKLLPKRRAGAAGLGTKRNERGEDRGMRISRRRILTAAGALPVLGSRIARAATPPKIRIAWVVAGANLVSILFAKSGIARHLGQSYEMQDVHFSSTPEMITALATGDLDIGTLAYSSFALAIENAKMADLRAIADEFQDGVPGYYTDEYMVLKDSPIKTVTELKGKVLATNGAGSA